MFRILIIILSISILNIFSGCSKDDNGSSTGGTLTEEGIAVVSTGGDSESNISVIDYKTGKSYNDLLSLHGTGELYQHGNYIYIVDKEGDRIIKFDPYNRVAINELSTGPSTSPDAIVFISDTKAYCTMSDSAAVKIFNPSSMKAIGSINISAFADADGNPDQGHAILKDGKVYVALRRSNGRSLTDHSSLAVINASNDSILGEIILKTNGISGASKNALGGNIGFSSSANGDVYPYIIGSVSKAADGAIEKLDAANMTTEIIMTESEIGGNISNWVFDTATTGWAIVGLSTASGGEGWGLKRFSLDSGAFTAVSTFQKSYYCWGVDYTADGLVLVGSQDENNPGVWVFDSNNEYNPVFEKPIDTGLPPERLIVVR